MKPDPQGSLEYFCSVDAPNGEMNGATKKRPRVD
jgi:hypothetical protein